MTDFQVCHICRLIWCALIIGGCAFLVFWKGASGAWFILAILMCAGECAHPNSGERE